MISQQVSEFNLFPLKPFASSSSDDQEPIKIVKTAGLPQ